MKSARLSKLSVPRKPRLKICDIDVRRYSYPNFTSCFPAFHETLSMKCQFVSTRCRGSPLSAPNGASPDTLIFGSPKLYLSAFGEIGRASCRERVQTLLAAVARDDDRITAMNNEFNSHL